MRIGEDILEVGSFGDYSLNGVEEAMLGNMVPMVGGYPVFYSQPIKSKHILEVVVGPNENITLASFKDLVSVKIFHGDEARFGSVSGLMGTFDGQMVARNGTSLHDDINGLAQDWQVTPQDGNLFRTVRAPQYPEQCHLPGLVAAKFAESG